MTNVSADSTSSFSMSPRNEKGVLVISLDFELYWGMRDAKTIEEYRKNLLGERQVVPALLRLFEAYEIHATWATVGFLFFETRDQLIGALPSKKPNYLNSNLSPYRHLHEIGDGEQEDPFHYASSLVQLIASAPYQEVGTHTFSHYYCLEKGQDRETFRDDLKAAIHIARKYHVSLESLVFPRNQFNSEYLSICREVGITAYRGNEASWIYRAKSREDESLLRRGLRLLDAYFSLSGHNCYAMNEFQGERPLNIPSSRFLRPVSKRLRILEPLRLRRILSDLTYAAQNGLMYHLWWHPHNFGDHTEDNLSFLSKILDHYVTLKRTYSMESLNMGEVAHRFQSGRKRERQFA